MIPVPVVALNVSAFPAETNADAARRIIRAATGESLCGDAPFLDCVGMDPLLWPQPAAVPIPWGAPNCLRLFAEPDFDGHDFMDEFLDPIDTDFEPEDEADPAEGDDEEPDWRVEAERNFWRDVLPADLRR